MSTVVLDLDGSVAGTGAARVVPLRDLEQSLRFACSRRALRHFSRLLDARLPDAYGTVLTGSGDFHHLSLPLIRRAAARHGPLQVVVFDNHPDNMRFPFGVHCGSWVRRACDLPGVRHVHVVGITSGDIGPAHAWENHWRPLRRGLLTYWSCGVDTAWARRFGIARAFRGFTDMSALLDAFGRHLAATELPVYLSIDKDVLSIRDVRTNWDQGQMREAQLTTAIGAMRGRIVGSDITGEVSVVRYRRAWKRLLSGLDRQPEIPAAQLSLWQHDQRALNTRLLDVLAAASVNDTAPASV